jgi:signal peptidase
MLTPTRRLHPGARGRVLPRPGAFGRFALRRFLRWLVAAALVGAWWMTVAPMALGGPASYVVTQGDSMLPTFEPGGLVVTRASDSYQVGDVVAYRNRQLDSVVLHRIVAEHDGRFVLQGDNNDFLDGYQPSTEDMVGTEWLELSGAGNLVRFVQQPLVFAVIIGVMVLLALRVTPPRNRHRRRHGAR